MSATTNDSDTPTTEDQKKRPRSPPDHSDILEALAELQYHLDDLPDDVVNEEMQLQLARLSAKLHRSPRREPIEIRDPFQRALYDLELRPERSLKIRTDNMKAISERSRALGNKHVINSEVFDGLVASLRNNFLDSPRSAPMLGRNLFASLGRDVFRVSPGRYIRDTSRLPELNPGHYTLQIQIYRYLCALLVFRNRRRPDEDEFSQFRGLPLICMYIVILPQAILEFANFAKKSRTQTLRGVVTDGFY